MFLYKIEIEMETTSAHLIILAETDEKAFSVVESHVARHYIKSPIITSAAIVEKKRTEPGAGYFIPQQ
ncbi:hypothetical protein Back11_27900 [Paenibacillus baekrokdamisoli]|uniref:Uncharacterized protein n=1 Tax=Paenibacillus baekrokdamisoli TaxID=1712516 RepID=A0A3G9IZ64_9BACL|nr:DUF3906 family protein [Paenibacillus baekrokdamisoli]MBB3071028.1 hypothetical protein [Paenibacillus baekrokdamisoli]BBH21445.1 hypothetical protein Back11_27900 [Paenibacillus baekrokdamisoli]